jgi:hypothetical protein
MIGGAAGGRDPTAGAPLRNPHRREGSRLRRPHADRDTRRRTGRPHREALAACPRVRSACERELRPKQGSIDRGIASRVGTSGLVRPPLRGRRVAAALDWKAKLRRQYARAKGPPVGCSRMLRIRIVARAGDPLLPQRAAVLDVRRIALHGAPWSDRTRCPLRKDPPGRILDRDPAGGRALAHASLHRPHVGSEARNQHDIDLAPSEGTGTNVRI